MRRTHFSKELKNTSTYTSLLSPIPAFPPTAHLPVLLSVTGVLKKALYKNRFRSILFVAFTLFKEMQRTVLEVSGSDYLPKTEADNKETRLWRKMCHSHSNLFYDPKSLALSQSYIQILKATQSEISTSNLEPKTHFKI